MAVAIDSKEHGCLIYKDIWSAGMDSELPYSPKFAIVETGKPLHTHAPIH